MSLQIVLSCVLTLTMFARPELARRMLRPDMPGQICFAVERLDMRFQIWSKALVLDTLVADKVFVGSLSKQISELVLKAATDNNTGSARLTRLADWPPRPQERLQPQNHRWYR